MKLQRRKELSYILQQLKQKNFETKNLIFSTEKEIENQEDELNKLRNEKSELQNSFNIKISNFNQIGEQLLSDTINKLEKSDSKDLEKMRLVRMLEAAIQDSENYQRKIFNKKREKNELLKKKEAIEFQNKQVSSFLKKVIKKQQFE